MSSHLRIALRSTVVTLLLTGVIYPLAVTGLAQLLFPLKANGSLARDDTGRVVGSELIGQAFVGAAYFQPRPSAAGEHGYDPLASGGSNLGPTSKALRERVVADVSRLGAANPAAGGPVPDELVTASASGLDPHISPLAASWQVPRVASSRRVAAERIRAVVEEYTEARDLGILGEPRVNVLSLNLALDRQFGQPSGEPVR